MEMTSAVTPQPEPIPGLPTGHQAEAPSWAEKDQNDPKSLMLSRAQNEFDRLLRAAPAEHCPDEAKIMVSAFFEQAMLLESEPAQLKRSLHALLQAIIFVRPPVSARRYALKGIINPQYDYADLPFTEALIGRTQICGEPKPLASLCPDFKTLLRETILFRLRSVMRFFQRRNPTIRRSLPRPFLLMPSFGEKLEQVVIELILPRMMTNKLIQRLSQSRDWTQVSTKELWSILERSKESRLLLNAWHAAWQDLHLPKLSRSSDKRRSHHWRSARVEAILAGDDYILPPIDNELLGFFSKLLSDIDIGSLEPLWDRLRQFYEQEMDKRVYQDVARDGALRDCLLDCFRQYPDEFSEMLVFLCYFNFPRLSLRYLTDFTRSLGQTEDERRNRAPRLMRFLDHPEIDRLAGAEDSFGVFRDATVDYCEARLKILALKAAEKQASWLWRRFHRGTPQNWQPPR